MADDNVTKVGFGEEFDTEPKFELIEDGEYEVTIAKVEPRTSVKNGVTTKRLSLMFKIRSDVDQKYKGRVIFYTIFGRDGDAYYDFRIVNKIIMTQLAKGEKLFLEGIDEVLQYLQNLNLRVGITSSFDTFRGEDANVVVEDSFKPSEHKGSGDGVAVRENTESIEVPDSDLPWMN